MEESGCHMPEGPIHRRCCMVPLSRDAPALLNCRSTLVLVGEPRLQLAKVVVGKARYERVRGDHLGEMNAEVLVLARLTHADIGVT